MELKLVLPMSVSINELYINEWAYQFNPKTRRKERMPTGRKILSEKGRRVKSRIQAEARMQLMEQSEQWDYEWTKDNYIYQYMTFYFPRRGMDDNNQLKLLNDSLEKVIYDNDSRVLCVTEKIMYDSKNPRIELKLTPVSYVGIFEDQHDADDFEARCEFGETNGCSRYRKGSCSILKDSLAGTVREEIGSVHSPICSSFKAKK